LPCRAIHYSKDTKNEYAQIKSPWDKQKNRNRRRRLVYAKINHNKETKK